MPACCQTENGNDFRFPRCFPHSTIASEAIDICSFASHRAIIKRRAFSLSALAIARRDNFGGLSTDVLLSADFSL
jgi:hypothetical protein